jgi:hypothetical protein
MNNQGFAEAPGSNGKGHFMASSPASDAISPRPTGLTGTVATEFMHGQEQGGDGVYPVKHHHPQEISELAGDIEGT